MKHYCVFLAKELSVNKETEELTINGVKPITIINGVRALSALKKICGTEVNTYKYFIVTDLENDTHLYDVIDDEIIPFEVTSPENFATVIVTAAYRSYIDLEDSAEKYRKQVHKLGEEVVSLKDTIARNFEKGNSVKMDAYEQYASEHKKKIISLVFNIILGIAAVGLAAWLFIVKFM